MPGSNRRFPRLQAGDRLQAAYLNNMAEAVERLDMFGDGVDGLANGAGVALRFPSAGWKQAVFRLQESLSRTVSATADMVQWRDDDWDGRDLQRSLAGDFFRGYAFPGDLVAAFYHPTASKWFALGSGHVFVRGTLDESLDTGGAANLSVTTYDPESHLWTDSSQDVTVHEAVGLDELVTAGTVLFATWHEQAQLWIGSLAPCPTETGG